MEANLAKATQVNLSLKKQKNQNKSQKQLPKEQRKQMLHGDRGHVDGRGGLSGQSGAARREARALLALLVWPGAVLPTLG